MENIAQNIFRLTMPYKDIYTTVLIIKTPHGAVLFDTATYRADVENTILPALRELGITEQELKYIVVSHSHGDHTGGLQWAVEAFPNARILSRCPVLREKYGAAVCCPEDGEMVLDSLQIFAVPGHSADSMCLLDTVTGTLISGDSLQLYGIYGSGTMGTSVSMPVEYLEAIGRLQKLDIKRIVASHDYHPCGHLAEGAAVKRYLDACVEAFFKIKAAVMENSDMKDMTVLAEKYNADSGLPAVSPRVFNAMRNAIDAGEI